MGFVDAINSAFGRYAVFSGRSRRSEFWWFLVFACLIGAFAALVGLAMQLPSVAVLVGLVVVLPLLAVSTRRLHDTGRGGWWLFAALIPVLGVLFVLVLQSQAGQPDANLYGEPPAPLLQWG